MDYSLCNRGLSSESVGSGCPVVRNNVIRPSRSSMTRPYDGGWCEGKGHDSDECPVLHKIEIAIDYVRICTVGNGGVENSCIVEGITRG